MISLQRFPRTNTHFFSEVVPPTLRTWWWLRNSPHHTILHFIPSPTKPINPRLPSSTSLLFQPILQWESDKSIDLLCWCKRAQNHGTKRNLYCMLAQKWFKHIQTMVWFHVFMFSSCSRSICYIAVLTHSLLTPRILSRMQAPSLFALALVLQHAGVSGQESEPKLCAKTLRSGSMKTQKWDLWRSLTIADFLETLICKGFGQDSWCTWKYLLVPAVTCQHYL